MAPAEPEDLPPPADPAEVHPLSSIVLVAANAIPVVGVFILGWNVFPILVLYWFENVVIGVMNVLRMLTAQPASGITWAGKFFAIPFFCVHYGLFTFVHGTFVFALFGPHGQNPMLRPDLFRDVVRQYGLIWAVVTIATSHVVSFIWNYLRGGEYRNAPLNVLMMQPYARVMVMHIVVLGGAFLVAALHQPQWAVALLVVLKTMVDLGSHRAERGKLSQP